MSLVSPPEALKFQHCPNQDVRFRSSLLVERPLINHAIFQNMDTSEAGCLENRTVLRPEIDHEACSRYLLERTSEIRHQVVKDRRDERVEKICYEWCLGDFKAAHVHAH